MTKLLEGLVQPDDSVLRHDLQDALNEVDRLNDEIRRARELNDQQGFELDKLRRIVSNLKQQLNPLHRALRAIFGEIDLAGIEDSPAEIPNASGATPPTTKKSAIWETWKQRLPGMYPGKFIDALLEHGSLDATQLAIITGCHRSNVAKEIYKLNNANLLNKNGGRYSLKSL